MNASQHRDHAASAPASAKAGTRIAVPPSAIANAIPAAGVRVPLELIGPCPMIRGSVNGQKGCFMLDVGTSMGVLLNSNRLRLGSSTRIGQGVAGSGQPVVLHLHDNVERLEIWSGAILENVGWAHSANFDFIEEGIAEDFLGFIGTGILVPYEFTLDYADGSILFSRLSEDGTPLASMYDHKDLVVALRFATNAAALYGAKLPLVDFSIGGFTIPLGFDTGNPGGTLVLTPEVKRALCSSGLLVSEGDRFGISNLTYGDSKISLCGINVELGAVQHGTIGYSLFRRYKTSWNYHTCTLKLFAPHGVSA